MFAKPYHSGSRVQADKGIAKCEVNPDAGFKIGFQVLNFAEFL